MSNDINSFRRKLDTEGNYIDIELSERDDYDITDLASLPASAPVDPMPVFDASPAFQEAAKNGICPFCKISDLPAGLITPPVVDEITFQFDEIQTAIINTAVFAFAAANPEYEWAKNKKRTLVEICRLYLMTDLAKPAKPETEAEIEKESVEPAEPKTKTVNSTVLVGEVIEADDDQSHFYRPLTKGGNLYKDGRSSGDKDDE